MRRLLPLSFSLGASYRAWWRGHGIEAVCLYLGLARTALLDLVVELDLPTPHDRPLRKAGGRKPWTSADIALFIVLWMAGWHAESLGDRFRRSPGSAWYKARQLGLPRRDRKRIFRPGRASDDLPSGSMQGVAPDPAGSGSGQARRGAFVRAELSQPDRCDLGKAALDLPQSIASSCDILPGLHTDTVIIPPSAVRAGTDLFGPTPVGMPPVRRAKRQHFEWTRERDRELAQRWWARQHYKAIARDMGLSPSAVQSRRIRLELPSFNTLPDLALLRRDELVDHFDPSVVAVNIAAARYTERKCNAFASEGKVFWFWKPEGRPRFTSDEFKRLEKRRETRPVAAARRPLPALANALHAW